MEATGDPAIVIDRAVTKHLEILRRASACAVVTFHRVQHRHAINRKLLQSVDNSRNLNTCSSKQRGHHIHHMMELSA